MYWMLPAACARLRTGGAADNSEMLREVGFRWYNKAFLSLGIMQRGPSTIAVVMVLLLQMVLCRAQSQGINDILFE